MRALISDIHGNFEALEAVLADIKSKNVKIPRGMLEYVAGMAGKVVGSIADDTCTRIMIKKPEPQAKEVIITITGKREGVEQATFIMANIVKTNMHRLNLTAASSSNKDKDKEKEKS